MADPSQYTYPSPLKGYEGLEPLSDEKTEDGKSLKNPQTGVKSDAYDHFVAPLTNGRRGGFDVHIYWFQNNPFQVQFAKELHERIRREFPELRIYALFPGPVGPHVTAMFEVNIHTPAQFGAFIPWLVIHRGPLSALIHPNTDADATEEEYGAVRRDGKGDVIIGDGRAEAERAHTQRATWMGEKLPLDLSLFKRYRELVAQREKEKKVNGEI